MFTANYSQTSQSSVGEDTFQQSYSEHQRPMPEWMELASYPCKNQDGTVVQLWRWKVKGVVIAVVDKPIGERYYLPSTHICNGLNPAEKGRALIDRLSGTLKTDRWKLIYYKQHVHIWPVGLYIPSLFQSFVNYNKDVDFTDTHAMDIVFS